MLVQIFQILWGSVSAVWPHSRHLPMVRVARGIDQEWGIKSRRDCLFRLHQSGYQTAEHGKGRWLQASLEPSSQRRLCLERTVCQVSRNLVKGIESISIVVNT